MTTPPRRRWRGLWKRIAPVLAMVGLILLAAVAWGTVAYVCGRKVFMVQDVQHFMRLVLPGIW